MSDSTAQKVSASVQGEAGEPLPHRSSSPPRPADLQGGGAQDDHEEHEGDRRGVAQVPEAEPLLVHQEGDAQGAVERLPLAGEHEGLGEELEVADAGHHRHEQEGGSEHRQRHVDELTPPAGALQAGGLVEGLGDALEPGRQDDHVDAEVLPDRQQDDRRHRPAGIPQPVDGSDPDPAEGMVQQPEAGVVEVAPDGGDRHQGGHRRREEGGAEDAGETGELRADHQRRRQRDQDGQRPPHQHEVEGVAHRLPEQVVAQQVEVVGGADEAEVPPVGDGVEVEIGEAEQQSRGDGEEEEQEDDRQPRPDEQPGRPDLAAQRAPARLSGHARLPPPPPALRDVWRGCGPPARPGRRGRRRRSRGRGWQAPGSARPGR